MTEAGINTKRLQNICELLTEQMNHWLLFPLALVIMEFAWDGQGGGVSCLLFWVLCSLFPLVFFALRCRTKRLISLTFLHFGAVAPLFLIPDSFYINKMICIITALGYMLYSLILRLKHNSIDSRAMHPAVGVGLSAAAFFIRHYQGIEGWENYYYFALIAGISLHFIIVYIEHYQDFLSKNQSSAGFLPAAEMFCSGMGLALGYTLLGACILVFSTQIGWFSGIWQLIKNALLRFLRFIFSYLPGAEPEAEQQPLAEELSPGEMGDLSLEMGKTFWLWKVLEIIVTILFYAGILFVIVTLSITLVRLIRQYLTLRIPGRKDIGNEEEIVDVREKCTLEETAGKKRRNIFKSLSHRERIRKLFKKKLLSAASRMQMGDGRLGVYTAKEWERKLATNGMAQVYELARYSREEVTAADVKRMKEACKENSKDSYKSTSRKVTEENKGSL